MSVRKRAASFWASRWFTLVWLVPLLLVAFALVVLAARGIRDLPAGRAFLEEFPGASALPGFAPVGFPAWLAWQHALTVFFLLFIVRTGWTLHRGGRPAMFWTRRNTGLIRTRNPPMRMSLTLWLHLSFDALWVLNGAVFYVLIFATGQWARIVPTRWDTVPNALSAALQYASLDWPSENGWVNYNALQLVSYFLVVFVAAPLAILTGLRLSPAWPRQKKRLDAVFPLKTARRVHYWVLIFFIAFTIVHVTLVLATGALNNLNHMYAVRNDDSWLGFWVFAASIVVMAAAWVGARPSVLRSIAAVGGRVSP